ncbi:MAG: cytoplasmic protein, partial [Deferrisomatales bacterium]
MAKRIAPEDLSALDRQIEEITAGARGDDGALRAFRQAFHEGVGWPADGFVVGEPVSVVAIEYDGNVRRGLTARCRRPDGGEHRVGAADLGFPAGSAGARLIGAYRRWLGLESDPDGATAAPRRFHKAAADDLDL